MTLLELLKSRLEVAKAFTKDFIEDTEKSIDDYYCKEDEREKLAQIGNINARYTFNIPYIYATQESMIAKILEKEPELIFTGKGADDEKKPELIEAVYEYLKDVCNLEKVAYDSLWWFLLAGFVKAHVEFKSEYVEVPVTDEMGQPVLDELGNPLTTISYTKNDPEVIVDDLKKVYFSPESVFTEKADKVPYLIREGLMDVEEVKSLYGKKVEPDSSLHDTDKKNVQEDDIKRVKPYFYYGFLKKTDDVKKHIKDFDESSEYYVVFTDKDILYAEAIAEKDCRIGKWCGNPRDFLGFGIGKTLRPFQKELSMRRGQQVRYADIAAYPKIGVEESSDVDPKALLDPRENVVLLFKDKLPAYLTVPDMSNTMILAEEKAREDAQFVSGILDLSKGAQQSTVVKTATGQTMFAEMSEMRLKQAKKLFGAYWKSLITLLFKKCQENWDEAKVLSITGEDGTRQQVEVNPEDLKSIDFDKDIDVQMESSSLNKDVQRAQAIEFYNAISKNPMINQEEALKFVMKVGFGQKDTARFISPQPMGMTPPMGQENSPSMPGSEQGQVQPINNVGV